MSKVLFYPAYPLNLLNVEAILGAYIACYYSLLFGFTFSGS
jgi:hypothetical protein